MRVMSSPVLRCVSSLSAFLAGFFPPPYTDTTLPISWQPIPFTVDADRRIVSFNYSSCPAFIKDKIMADNFFEPETRKWMEENKEILERVSEYLIIPLNNTNIIYEVADLLETNRFLDPSFPTWLLNDLKIIMEFRGTVSKSFWATERQKRATAGNLISLMIKNMFDIKSGSQEARNMLIYSGHDFTILALNHLLGVESQVPMLPFYGDTIAVELVESEKGSLNVQVVYVTGNTTNILNVPNCGTSCSLEIFARNVKHLSSFNWDRDCKA